MSLFAFLFLVSFSFIVAVHILVSVLNFDLYFVPVDFPGSVLVSVPTFSIVLWLFLVLLLSLFFSILVDPLFARISFPVRVPVLLSALFRDPVKVYVLCHVYIYISYSYCRSCFCSFKPLPCLSSSSSSCYLKSDVQNV